MADGTQRQGAGASGLYPLAGPAGIGLDVTVRQAWRSPFFARKLQSAGWQPDSLLTWEMWTALPPTTKDELRSLTPFEEQLSSTPREETVEYWRSGGVTGQPLFYPRTKSDVEASRAAFAAALEFAGVGPTDVFLCSLPLGLHPAGQQMLRAAESLGAATVWAGGGNQTASETQARLIEELGVTVWCGMPSFALHLAHLAQTAGHPLAGGSVRRVITTAEPLPLPKRSRLETMWDARVVDTFGMSELTLFGVECGRLPGLHASTRQVFCEVLDPISLQPVPAGEVGSLCVTPVNNTGATPFLRWLSGDVVRLEQRCNCDHSDEPRLVHSGRTNAFFKVKGVNVNHAEVEEAFFKTAGLKDYLVSVTPENRLYLELECSPESETVVRNRVVALFADEFGLRADVVLCPHGTIASRLEGQIKPQRFVDLRTQ